VCLDCVFLLVVSGVLFANISDGYFLSSKKIIDGITGISNIYIFFFSASPIDIYIYIVATSPIYLFISKMIYHYHLRGCGCVCLSMSLVVARTAICLGD
jgi:hypothetical protein